MNIEIINNIRKILNEDYRKDEYLILKKLISSLNFSEKQLLDIEKKAYFITKEVQNILLKRNFIDSFIQKYSLSTKEGISLMCLSEALLRIPDNKTIDEFIDDKINSIDWLSNINKNNSVFTNITLFSLLVTGKILKNKYEINSIKRILLSLLKRSSIPFIRKVILYFIKFIGNKFILGNNIQEAINKSQKKSFSKYKYSYDMLGESAKTYQDAEKYFNLYKNSVEHLGKIAYYKDIYKNPNISIKISALHPRYEFLKKKEVFNDILKKIKILCLKCKEYNISLTIDAEESDRLDFSLDLFEKIFSDKEFNNWEGLGIVVQAYQKRAISTIEWLKQLSIFKNKKMFLRLVKGAYWDYEIKNSQISGVENYPVFTKKCYTDVSYLACVKKILSCKLIYPQFATHNIRTIFETLEIFNNEDRYYEFQCLNGMGFDVYNTILKYYPNIIVRNYAPVGVYKNLLGYLVRRILENAANTSFINQISNKEIQIKDIIYNPIKKSLEYNMKKNNNIVLPENIYKDRKNSSNIDVHNPSELQKLLNNLGIFHKKYYDYSCKESNTNNIHEQFSPFNHNKKLGKINFISKDEINNQFEKSNAAYKIWNNKSLEHRCNIVNSIGDIIEKYREELIFLLINEAGKTLIDALDEIRESIDFCRYYSTIARKILKNTILPSPTGESNILKMHGRGVMLCISPWNFPLAIFIGQITSALVSGNSVIAKPALQTSLIAKKMVSLINKFSIIEENTLQICLGKSSNISETLLNNKYLSGVIFTGSNTSAKNINRTLSLREGAILPIIAETGGQNAMIVDSTALPEQVIDDVVKSAFYSSGQRCSSLRVLYIQEDISEDIINMIIGAMKTLTIGDPNNINTDIGPIIDKNLQKTLFDHIKYLDLHSKKEVNMLFKCDLLTKNIKENNFFPPYLYKINNIKILKKEVFGPILHIIEYKKSEINKVIESINNTGYGLTFGIHSRIKNNIDYITKKINVGNIYINKHITGAVVESQPFGGEGLSGTGPKAGGPNYLLRMCKERVYSENLTAIGGNIDLMSMQEK